MGSLAVASIAVAMNAGCHCSDSGKRGAQGANSAQAANSAQGANSAGLTAGSGKLRDSGKPGKPLTPQQLQRTIKLLLPLHREKRLPKAGEWLAEHNEPGQTFQQWLDSAPTIPTPQRHALLVQPLGKFNPVQRRIVKHTAAYLGHFFGLQTQILEDLPLSVVRRKSRRRHPQTGKPQIHSGAVLDVLRRRLPRRAAAYIAFTVHDLWPGDGWNYVFGQASLDHRVGVWSLHRFGDPSASKEAFKQVLLRTLKLAVHETGHMFSIEHCTAHECVMGGSNSLDETDRQPVWLGPQCMAKVVWAAKLDARERYHKLASFMTHHGFAEQARFFQASIASLAGIQPKR